MKLFSKFVFIANVCFFIAMILRMVEISKNKAAAVHNGAVQLNPMVSSIVVLGWLAIFFNIIFIIFFLVRFARRRMDGIPKWLVYFNFIALPAQIIYYFFT